MTLFLLRVVGQPERLIVAKSANAALQLLRRSERDAGYTLTSIREPL